MDHIHNHGPPPLQGSLRKVPSGLDPIHNPGSPPLQIFLINVPGGPNLIHNNPAPPLLQNSLRNLTNYMTITKLSFEI